MLEYIKYQRWSLTLEQCYDAEIRAQENNMANNTHEI